jgi:2-methylcitrate dehydratase PrpD
MDAAEAIAETSVKVSFESLPQAAVDNARAGLLDTLGVSLAATTLAAETARPLVELVHDWGGNPECTLLGHGTRIPAPSASWILGAYAHMLDYDDIVDVAVSHPSAPVIAAVLPLAEKIGSVDGERLLTAVALGQDLNIRLNLALPEGPPWYGWLPSVNGVLGAALAAAKLLDLDVEQTLDALGLALHSVGGSAQCGLGSGSQYRGVRDGFSARAGLVCALLGQRGFRGDRDVLDGKHGLYQLYFAGQYDRQQLVDGLGTQFRGELIGHKPWPSCGYSHLFIAPLLDIMRQYALTAADIAEIAVASNDPILETQCTPKATRTAPVDSIDARQSLPFQLGKVATSANLVLADFTPEGLDDDRAIAMAKRVRWEVTDFPGVTSKLGVGRVEVYTLDGRTFSAMTEHAPGCPDDRLSWDALCAKFRDCASHSRIPLPESTVDAVIAMIGGLESEPDVGRLVPSLSLQSPA